MVGITVRRPPRKSRTRPPAVRPRAAHLGPERRRPLVLDAALAVFMEHGYRGTSMQAVAAVAGVTKPVLYECFASKQEMFAALMEREERRLLDGIRAALPQRPEFDNVEALVTAGLTAFLTAATAAPDSWRVVFNSQHGNEPAIAERVRRVRAGLLEQLRDLIELYLDSVEVADTARKAPVLAELLASMAEASARLLIVERTPWTPSELGHYLAKLSTRGVAHA